MFDLHMANAKAKEEKRKPVNLSIKPSIEKVGRHAALDAEQSFPEWLERAILALAK